MAVKPALSSIMASSVNVVAVMGQMAIEVIILSINYLIQHSKLRAIVIRVCTLDLVNAEIRNPRFYPRFCLNIRTDHVDNA